VPLTRKPLIAGVLHQDELMNQFMYSVWIKDHSDKMEDDGYEYPACIIIEAIDSIHAKEWGDKISLKFTKDNPENEILYSKVENMEEYETSDISSVPIIKYGSEPSDREIGW
jgi:hypothetical protein